MGARMLASQKALILLFSVAGLLVAVPASAAKEDRGWLQGTRAITIQYYPYPYWGWGPSYYYYDTRGKIKIRDYNETDQVYINGAYAGTVKKRKTIRLEPGQYTIEVRRRGKELVKRDVYVLTQKTVEVHVPYGAD